MASSHSCSIFHCITRFVLTTRDAISNANSFCTLQNHITKEKCSVRVTLLSFHAHFAQMQRVNQDLIFHSPRTISEVPSSNFFTHDIFHLDARAVKRIRGCVADFNLVFVHYGVGHYFCQNVIESENVLDLSKNISISF